MNQSIQSQFTKMKSDLITLEMDARRYKRLSEGLEKNIFKDLEQQAADVYDKLKAFEANLEQLIDTDREIKEVRG